MSDTPRTDYQEMSPRLDIEGTVVSSDFARQLERELAEARQQRDTLAEAMTEYMDHHIQHGFVTTAETIKAWQTLVAVKGGSHE